MNREGVATVEILPDVAGFAVAMACATIHPRSEWERAVQRIVDTLAGSRDDLLALLRTLPGSGWTPAEAAAAAELIASQPKPLTSHGLHITREQIERALRVDNLTRTG